MTEILQRIETSDRFWHFRVLSSDGSLYGQTKHYYTAEAAEKAGREWGESHPLPTHAKAVGVSQGERERTPSHTQCDR